MRYLEAYEIIDAGLTKSQLGFPVTEPLKAQFFDNVVNDIGVRTVKKESSETFTTTKTKSYTLTSANASNKIFKVEYDTDIVPFVDGSVINVNVADDDVSNLGYYYVEDRNKSGSITAGTSANPVAITSASHGLSTGDFIVISGIGGLKPSTTEPSQINGKRFSITSTGTNTYTIPVDGSSYDTAYVSSTGEWILDNKAIKFNKNVDAGKTLTIYYYSLPIAKTNSESAIDLPDTLITSAIHHTLGHFLMLDGQLQLGSGHIGMGKTMEQDYLKTHQTRKATYDTIPVPLQDFIY
tara:strand:- start:3428 stop:4312 length:885 start_codon:yes stop_codon:yes gene_type:complete